MFVELLYTCMTKLETSNANDAKSTATHTDIQRLGVHIPTQAVLIHIQNCQVSYYVNCENMAITVVFELPRSIKILAAN